MAHPSHTKYQSKAANYIIENDDIQTSCASKHSVTKMIDLKISLLIIVADPRPRPKRDSQPINHQVRNSMKLDKFEIFIKLCQTNQNFNEDFIPEINIYFILYQKRILKVFHISFEFFKTIVYSHNILLFSFYKPKFTKLLVKISGQVTEDNFKPNHQTCNSLFQLPHLCDFQGPISLVFKFGGHSTLLATNAKQLVSSQQKMQ